MREKLLNSVEGRYGVLKMVLVCLLLLWQAIEPLTAQVLSTDQKRLAINMLDSLADQHDSDDFIGLASRRLGAFWAEFAEADLGKVRQELLEIAEKEFGETHQIPAFLYHRYGIDAYLDDDFGQALELLNKGLDIRQAVLPEAHPATAHSWYILGLTHYYNDSEDLALEAYRQSLSLYQAIDQNEMVSNCYRRLGQTYDYLEEYELAALYFDLALIYGQQSMAPQALSLANLYRSAAAVEKRPKTEALQYYERAAQIFELGQHTDAANYSSVLINQAEILIDLGQYQEAKELLQSVLTQKQKAQNTSELDIIYEYFGVIHRHFKEYTLALERYQQVLQLRLKRKGKLSEDANYTYHNLGEVYQEMGDYQRAAEYYQKALQAADSAFVSDTFSENPDVSTAVLTTSYADLIKDLDFKGQLFLAWFRRDRDPERLRIALATFERATAFMYDKRDDLIGQGSKLIWQEKLFPLLEHYLEALYTALELDLFSGQEEQIFQLMERGKALVLMESLLEQQRAVDFPGRDQLETKINERQVVFAERQRQLLENEDRKEERRIAMLDAKIDYLEAQRVLKSALSAQYANMPFSELVITAGSSENLLSDAQGLLHYFVGDQKVYALFLTRGKTYVHTFPSTDLSERVNHFRSLLNQPDGNWAEFSTQSYDLYTRLLQPLFSQVASLPTELIIIPDGVLSALPFEVLLSEKSQERSFSTVDAPYLLRTFEVSYAFSASTWQQQVKQEASQGSLSFLGLAPSFDEAGLTTESRTCARGSLGPLSENEREVEALNQILQGKFKNGAAATKAYFLAQAGNAKVLHLATHACVDDTDGARSRIFFSDDHLYVHELYNLPLVADMVVLSACETGVGTFRRGEGVMSLARGFAVSGAPSLTLSYWSVSDKSTAEIMKYYYQYLAEGQPKHAALRKAKLTYLSKQEQSRYLHPYYWAAFVHFGDFTPLSVDHQGLSIPWLSLLFILAFTLVSYLVYHKFVKSDH